MRIFTIGLFCTLVTIIKAQDAPITSMDFVQILNNHEAEAVYYFQNNWKVLRQQAIEKNYISDFKLLRTQRSEEAPFDIILMTTYPDQTRYDQREANFAELIEAKGGLKLLNEKEPGNSENPSLVRAK